MVTSSLLWRSPLGLGEPSLRELTLWYATFSSAATRLQLRRRRCGGEVEGGDSCGVGDGRIDGQRRAVVFLPPVAVTLGGTMGLFVENDLE